MSNSQQTNASIPEFYFGIAFGSDHESAIFGVERPISIVSSLATQNESAENANATCFENDSVTLNENVKKRFVNVNENGNGN